MECSPQVVRQDFFRDPPHEFVRIPALSRVVAKKTPPPFARERNSRDLRGECVLDLE